MAVLNEIEVDGITYTLFDINKIYPIGSIYMNVNSTNPSNIFGGTWEQIKDKFLLCAGDSYVSGTTGGESSHILTVEEMPEHAHNFPKEGQTENGMYFGSTYNAHPNVAPDGKYWWSTSGYTGGSSAHNNMPPYLAVNVWKRTA